MGGPHGSASRGMGSEQRLCVMVGRQCDVMAAAGIEASEEELVAKLQLAATATGVQREIVTSSCS